MHELFVFSIDTSNGIAPSNKSTSGMEYQWKIYSFKIFVYDARRPNNSQNINKAKTSGWSALVYYFRFRCRCVFGLKLINYAAKNRRNRTVFFLYVYIFFAMFFFPKLLIYLLSVALKADFETKKIAVFIDSNGFARDKCAVLLLQKVVFMRKAGK